MRRCLETDCRVVWKLSAMAFGVIACKAIKLIIARLVGSAIAWKMSRLILCTFFCFRNCSVANICATIRFRKFFLDFTPLLVNNILFLQYFSGPTIKYYFTPRRQEQTCCNSSVNIRLGIRTQS